MAQRSREGAINAHTHLYSGLAPLGLPKLDPKPRNFLDILERRWWRLDRALDEMTLRASARYSIAEALCAGTTTLVDHHESPNFIRGSLDILADACEELGIRALLCYGITERNGGADEADLGLLENERFIENNRRKRIKGAVGIHASFTVSDETLSKAGALARRLGVVVHVHIAEDRADVDDAKRRGYEGPLQRMLHLEALPPGSILAHGVFLSEAEVALAADAGLWLVQNPRSNEENQVGFAESLGQNARVALGTDGFPSDMRAESSALLQIASERGVAFAGLLKAQREEASRRLVEEIFGSVKEDRVDEDDENETNIVKNVVIAGRDIVREGKLLTADRATIQEEAALAAHQLFSRMQSIGDHHDQARH